MSKVFGVKRNFVEFDYEFLDGKKTTFKYFEPNSKMIDETMKNIDDAGAAMRTAKEQLKECLKHEDENMVEQLFDEQYENGNIYEFMGELNELIAQTKKKKLKN